MSKIPNNLRFFIGLVVIFPVVDIINGFFLATGITVPVGISYRLIFFFFLIAAIFLDTMPKTSYTFITFLFISGNIIIFLLQSIFLQRPLSGVFEDSSVYIKYFLWVLIPYYIYQRKQFFQIINFNKLFVVINVFFTFGMLIPYTLGVGTYTYIASNAGYKGYFFAQNDISMTYIILITLSGWELVGNLKNKWGVSTLSWLFLYVGNFYCLLLIGMKTGVAYGIVITIYVLSSLIFGKGYRSTLHQIFVWMMSVLAIFFTFSSGITYAIKMVAGPYERLVYFYNLYNGDLVRLLSSSRSVFLEGGMNAFITDSNFWFTFFWGQGFSYRVENFGRLGLIEMDFFDVLFGLGTVGTTLLLLVIGYFLMVSVRKYSTSIFTFVFFIAILYSFFAGHVLFSALSSTFFGLICGAIILSRKE